MLVLRMKQNSLPESLIKDIESEECVVFLGAGASTEGHKYFPKNLVETLMEKCSYPRSSPIVLPKVARYFCDVLDGGFKGRLVREIRDYLDLYMERGEANNMATMAHAIIAKIGLLKVIVTTNWDVFMERELNVLPIVRDADLVYWSDDKRQVIKLHGCIGQPDTMVATEDDYKDFMRNRLDSPISNKIKDLMATKTFLFLGYSLRDQSFQLIHDGVLSKMGRFSRCSYAVLHEPTKEYARSLRKRGVIIISANVIAFLRDLHEAFIHKGLFFDEEFVETASDWIDRLCEVHLATGQEDDIGFFSMMYQDGLQHSLQGIYYGILIGKPKSHYRKELEFYSEKLKDEMRTGDPTEISYFRGRVEALKWALDSKHELRLYCNRKLEPINNEEFAALRKSSKKSLLEKTRKNRVS
jgi:hypothetical protein